MGLTIGPLPRIGVGSTHPQPPHRPGGSGQAGRGVWNTGGVQAALVAERTTAAFAMREESSDEGGAVSGVRSRGRAGHTVVPNWRWEDAQLDSYDLHVAGWLASHADRYAAEHVSANEVARRTGISKGRVLKSLERLAGLAIIGIERGARERLVITLDLDVWNDGRPPLTGHHMTGDRSPHDRTAPSHLPIGETQRETPPTAPPGGAVVAAVAGGLSSTVDQAFEAFYERYPRKVGKPAARRAFKAAVAVEPDLRVIGAGLRRWMEYWSQRRTAVDLIPHPSTWLNQHRWQDDPGPAAQQVAGGGRVRPLTTVERSYQRRTHCTDDEARAWGDGQRRRDVITVNPGPS